MRRRRRVACRRCQAPIARAAKPGRAVVLTDHNVALALDCVQRAWVLYDAKVLLTLGATYGDPHDGADPGPGAELSDLSWVMSEDTRLFAPSAQLDLEHLRAHGSLLERTLEDVRVERLDARQAEARCRGETLTIQTVSIPVGGEEWACDGVTLTQGGVERKFERLHLVVAELKLLEPQTLVGVFKALPPELSLDLGSWE